jgi:hypothetical protein
VTAKPVERGCSSRLNAKVRQRRRGQIRGVYACETGSSLAATVCAPSIYGRRPRLEAYRLRLPAFIHPISTPLPPLRQ